MSVDPLLKVWFEDPDGFVAKVLEFARAMKGSKVDRGENKELKIKPS